MNTPPPPERVRLTISVSPEVHQAYAQLAQITGTSIGREMGDFLAETVDAVRFMATKLDEARSAPRLVMREMHAYATGLADETGAILKRVSRAAPGTRAASSAPGAAPAPVPPRPVIRGGKSPKGGSQPKTKPRRKS